jgi:5-deoxy-glucuronate isomerase
VLIPGLEYLLHPESAEGQTLFPEETKPCRLLVQGFVINFMHLSKVRLFCMDRYCNWPQCFCHTQKFKRLIIEVLNLSKRFISLGSSTGDFYEVEAVTDLELAVCSAPGKGTHPARLIAPEDVGVEMRGAGNIERRIHNILPEQKPADSLLVVEVFTPEGNWSSYPPHKHDQDHLPHESYLEETYYHRVNPDHGFAVQRVYTDDRSLDETMIVKNGDAVWVPKGYHPVSAPPGYEIYYLNVMAGPVRTWKFHNDPDHEWVMERKLATKQFSQKG